MEPDKGDDDKKAYLIQQPSKVTDLSYQHLSDESPPGIPRDLDDTETEPVSPVFNDSNTI